jgi:hypothetical protein
VSVESAQERLDAARRRYETWADRGEARGGRRLTIMTATTEVGPGGPVEVEHVVEALGPEHRLYVMGPKPVLGEQVDGAPQGKAPPPDSLEPGDYDGVTLPGPGIDANFEATTYAFDEPGEHEIVWEAGGLRSNVLRIRVTR